MTVAVAVMALTGTGFAQETDDSSFTEAELVTSKVEPFETIDHDADDQLSWEEVRNMVTRIFLETDTSGNGALNAEEFSFGDQHWAVSDLDGDGQVDLRDPTGALRMSSTARRSFSATWTAPLRSVSGRKNRNSSPP